MHGDREEGKIRGGEMLSEDIKRKEKCTGGEEDTRKEKCTGGEEDKRKEKCTAKDKRGR